MSGDRLATLIMDNPNRLNAEVAAVSTGEECVAVAMLVVLFRIVCLPMHMNSATRIQQKAHSMPKQKHYIITTIVNATCR